MSRKLVLLSARFGPDTRESDARQLASFLRDRERINVFIVDALPGDGGFGKQTAFGLSNMAVMVAFCTPTYGEKTSSRYCSYYEVERCVEDGIPVIPIKLCSEWPPHPPRDGDEGFQMNQMLFKKSAVYHDWSEKEFDAAACAKQVAENLRSLASRGIITWEDIFLQDMRAMDVGGHRGGAQQQQQSRGPCARCGQPVLTTQERTRLHDNRYEHTRCPGAAAHSHAVPTVQQLQLDPALSFVVAMHFPEDAVAMMIIAKLKQHRYPTAASLARLDQTDLPGLLSDLNLNAVEKESFEEMCAEIWRKNYREAGKESLVEGLTVRACRLSTIFTSAAKNPKPAVARGFNPLATDPTEAQNRKPGMSYEVQFAPPPRGGWPGGAGKEPMEFKDDVDTSKTKSIASFPGSGDPRCAKLWNFMCLLSREGNAAKRVLDWTSSEGITTCCLFAPWVNGIHERHDIADKRCECKEEFLAFNDNTQRDVGCAWFKWWKARLQQCIDAKQELFCVTRDDGTIGRSQAGQLRYIFKQKRYPVAFITLSQFEEAMRAHSA